MMEVFSRIYVIRQILQGIHPIAANKLGSCVEQQVAAIVLIGFAYFIYGR